MKRLFFLLLALIFSAGILQAKILTQTIRGSVIDGDSKNPIAGANVYVIESNPPIFVPYGRMFYLLFASIRITCRVKGGRSPTGSLHVIRASSLINSPRYDKQFFSR